MKVCFFCSGKSNLKNFNTVLFRECIRVELFRKKNNLKYSHVKIPKSMNKTAYHVQCFNTFATLNFDESEEYEAALLNENVECTASTLDEQILVARAADSENVKNAGAVVMRQEEESTWSNITSLLHEVHEDTLIDTLEIKIEEAPLDIKEERDPLEVAENETLVSQLSASGVKVPPPRCIFCSKFRKQAGRCTQSLTKALSQDNINILKEQAEKLGDADVLEKLQDCDWDCISYHKVCYSKFKTEYKKRFEEKEPKPKGPWNEIRELNARAFERLSEFIHTEVIEKEQFFYLSDLNAKYKAMLLELNTYFLEEEIRNSSVHLEEKILNKFGDKIIIRTSNKCQSKKIVYKRNININNVISDFLLHQAAEKTAHQSVAYDIRNAVKSIEHKRLPLPLKVEDIIEGECDVPDELLDFMCDVIQGPDKRRRSSSEDLVKIKSICQDIIFITTKGRVKPSKHLVLALAMKSLTGSRNALTLLNKYGHAVSYTLALAVENALISSGHSSDSNVFTNVALDNCDTVSATEKDVVTVNNDDSQSDVESPTSSSSDHAPPERKRRRYGGRLRDTLKNYREKDKEIDAEHLNDDEPS